MLMSARKVHAEEALQLGLVSRIHAKDELVDKAVEYAHEMAAITSPRTSRIIKRQLWHARSCSFADALAESMAETKACMDTEDFREGVASFKEKRPARFTGR
jgi:enoyl-CoA hydratase/carnithine racemase